MIQFLYDSVYTITSYTFFTFSGVNFSIITFSLLIIYLAIVWLTIKLFQLFIKKFLLVKLSVDVGTSEAITSLTSYFLGLLGILIVLESIGFNLSSLVVIVGSVGVGLGFGLQDIAKDIVSGIILLLRRTIKVDHFLEILTNEELKDLKGTVQNISLLSTLIETKDGATLILPNSFLVSSPILNWSFTGNSNRLKIPIYLLPDSDLVLFTETVLSTVSEEQAVFSQPPPKLVLKELGEKYLEFELLIWIKTVKDEEFVVSSVNYAIEYNLRQRGIAVSFPESGHVADLTSQEVKLQPQISVRDLLKKVPYFANFTELELRKVIEIGYRQRLTLGQVLFKEGEPGDAFYIVLEGKVEIFAEKLNKQLNVFTEGTFFGELSLMLGIPRTASVKALETTTLFVIHRKQFEKLLQEQRELAEVIIQELPKYKEEMVARKKQLREMNILDDDTEDNIGIWVRKRLQKVFSLSF